MGSEQSDQIDKLTAGVEALRAEVADNTRKTEEILKGFPGRDADGHRRYHEEVMQQMAERRKLRQELLTHLIKGSSWAALSGFAYVLWRYLIGKTH